MTESLSRNHLIAQIIDLVWESANTGHAQSAAVLSFLGGVLRGKQEAAMVEHLRPFIERLADTPPQPDVQTPLLHRHDPPPTDTAELVKHIAELTGRATDGGHYHAAAVLSWLVTAMAAGQTAAMFQHLDPFIRRVMEENNRVN